MASPFDDVQPIGDRPSGARARATGRAATDPTRTSSPDVAERSRAETDEAWSTDATRPRERREERDEPPVAPMLQPRQFAVLSQGEKQRRGALTHAERAGRGDVHTGSKKPRWSRRPLRVGELLEMCSQVARRFHDGATAEGARASDAKHCGIGLAVMVDKLNALSGRPTEILGLTDAVRPATHDLASKLALVAKRATA